MGDPVVQWQVVTNQPDKHAAFYSAVFGWKISADNPLGYRIQHRFWPGNSRRLLARAARSSSLCAAVHRG